MRDQYGKGEQPETSAFEGLGLDGVELPEWFEYPKAFKRLVRLGLVDLEPWFIINGARVVERMKGLKTRYRMRGLVPFARRSDNDQFHFPPKIKLARALIPPRRSILFGLRQTKDQLWTSF